MGQVSTELYICAKSQVQVGKQGFEYIGQDNANLGGDKE
jgi:hypothetical protein